MTVRLLRRRGAAPGFQLVVGAAQIGIELGFVVENGREELFGGKADSVS